MTISSDFFSIERTQDLWTVRFHPLDSMMFMREDLTEAIFQLLAEIESKRVKVLLADYPAGSLAPTVVDRFWEEANKAPSVRGTLLEPPLPVIVRTVSAAIPRLIKHIQRLKTFSIVSFQGEIDFDLFGVLLASNYRICSDETVFGNRVLDREFSPGSGIFWLLARYLGFAEANHILVEGKSLTAQEALDLRLVNRVVSGAELESESQLTAERFAAKPARALESLVRASLHLEEDLATHLERVGTGFEG
jgi:Enoyl-CoA hydratase/isomerase